MPDAGGGALIIAWEPLSVALDDGLEALVEQHWREVSRHRDKRPLAVQWEKYHLLADRGILRLLSARLDGALIGYAAYFYDPHIHYGLTPSAPCDAIFVLAERRGTGAGMKMVDIAEACFMTEAAPEWINISYHDRAGVELLGPGLRKRGYEASDITYDKMVRAQ